MENSQAKKLKTPIDLMKTLLWSSFDQIVELHNSRRKMWDKPTKEDAIKSYGVRGCCSSLFLSVVPVYLKSGLRLIYIKYIADLHIFFLPDTSTAMLTNSAMYSIYPAELLWNIPVSVPLQLLLLFLWYIGLYFWRANSENFNSLSTCYQDLLTGISSSGFCTSQKCAVTSKSYDLLKFMKYLCKNGYKLISYCRIPVISCLFCVFISFSCCKLQFVLLSTAGLLNWESAFPLLNTISMAIYCAVKVMPLSWQSWTHSTSVSFQKTFNWLNFCVHQTVLTHTCDVKSRSTVSKKGSLNCRRYCLFSSLNCESLPNKSFWNLKFCKY